MLMSTLWTFHIHLNFFPGVFVNTDHNMLLQHTLDNRSANLAHQALSRPNSIQFLWSQPTDWLSIQSLSVSLHLGLGWAGLRFTETTDELKLSSAFKFSVLGWNERYALCRDNTDSQRRCKQGLLVGFVLSYITCYIMRVGSDVWPSLA